MKKFEALHATILSTPIIECESPFFLSFDVAVHGDAVPATFVGNFARALQNNIRVGDEVILRDGIIDNGRLVFEFIHMKPEAAIGRNVNIVA